MGRSTARSCAIVTGSVPNPDAENASNPRHFPLPTKDSSAESPFADTKIKCHIPSVPCQSADYSYSINHSVTERSITSKQELVKHRNRKPRWYESVKNWITISEPSARALKSQRVTAYDRFGIDLKDPQAAAKMHLPISKIPGGVTTSTTGPTPEKALAEHSKQATEMHCHAKHGGSHSLSSDMSFHISSQDTKKIAPWVE